MNYKDKINKFKLMEGIFEKRIFKEIVKQVPVLLSFTGKYLSEFCLYGL